MEVVIFILNGLEAEGCGCYLLLVKACYSEAEHQLDRAWECEKSHVESVSLGFSQDQGLQVGCQEFLFEFRPC